MDKCMCIFEKTDRGHVVVRVWHRMDCIFSVSRMVTRDGLDFA